MILTEPGLRWRRSLEAVGPRGETCVRFDCVEYERLYMLKQRQSEASEWRTLFYVRGIEAQHYEDPMDALAAMRDNP